MYNYNFFSFIFFVCLFAFYLSPTHKICVLRKLKSRK